MTGYLKHFSCVETTLRAIEALLKLETKEEGAGISLTTQTTMLTWDWLDIAMSHTKECARLWRSVVMSVCDHDVLIG